MAADFQFTEEQKAAMAKAVFDNDYSEMKRLKTLGRWPYIACPKCGMVSYNPNDILERYCGNCHQFHDQMEVTD